MSMEPISHLINKTSHWPIGKRRKYLIAAMEYEKGRWRRRQIHLALRSITTKVLRGEKS